MNHTILEQKQVFSPATKPEPWTITKNKTYTNQGLFSDSDSDTDSADYFITQTSKKTQSTKHKIENLLDINTLTDEHPISHKANATQNKQTQPNKVNTNTNAEHTPQKHTSNTTLQIHNHI